MIQDLLLNPTSLLARISTDPGDSEEARLQKTLLVGAVFMGIFAGTIWGILYLLIQRPLAGSIPLSYVAVSSLTLGFFAVTHRHHLLLFSHLLLILLLPILLMMVLGGFVNSSAVILWALICPLGALLFSEPRHAPRWFLAYLGLLVASGFLQPYVSNARPFSTELLTTFFVLNLGGVSTLSFILLYYFVGQKNRFLALLRIEQEKSENLLLNILPREIAAILKNEQRTIADQFDGASILFADLVGFTPLTAELPPVEMVELLNEVFSQFDSLVEKYDLEKIRTIGDNYMVAAGVPRRRPDHAQAMAGMALEMSEYLRRRPSRNGKRLEFRIGINSGPVVGGVIGRKKFVYDLWGDAVNIASRMESQGVPGKIQITRETYEIIKQEFVCEPRGTVVVKGRDAMETWYLVGRQSGSIAIEGSKLSEN